MGSTGSGPIQNLQNSLCLGVTGSKATYGYPLAWQTCSGSTAQQFSLIPGATAGYSLIQLPLSSTGNTAFCIDVGNPQINYNCSTTNTNQVFYTPNMKYSNTSSIKCDDPTSQTLMTLPGNGNKFKDVIVKYGRWDNTGCAGTGVTSNTSQKYVFSPNTECNDKNYCSISLPTTDPYFGVYKQYQIFSNNVGGSPLYITIAGGTISKVVNNDNNKTYILHTFTASGKFTVNGGNGLISAFYLVVGGGGNGGNSEFGSGGGGGAVIFNTSSIKIGSGSDYQINVGSQGNGSDIQSSSSNFYKSAGAGKNGSSGRASGGASIGETGLPISGGSGSSTSGRSYGGGGAAYGSGRGRGGNKNQDGQNGLKWWLNSKYYGGGGGGGVYNKDDRSDIDGGQYGGAGGEGGGGNGGLQGTKDPTNASFYGGGGGGGAKSNGASGYQGIVIIAYCPEENVG